MDQNCEACKNVITNDDALVVCEGFCTGMRRFHARCVNLKDEESQVCLFPNVMWMCDCCRDLMETIKFRSTVNAMRSIQQQPPVPPEINTLNAEVLKISESLNKLADTVDSLKHGLNVNCTQDERSLVEESTPLSSTALELPRPSAVRAEDHHHRHFKLHLSNIANDVTTEEVMQMIEQSLRPCEIIAIHRLVPEWKDVSSLDYISFKIELNRKHRIAALTTSNWPNGIRCREFKDRPSNAWRPAHRNCTI